MPNARKKKAAKMEDFKKKKLKVGKQKAQPDNFTDTSFRSKTVTLPNQSITEDKSHEITTSRNLTLADLVIQLRHYNSGVKKEALGSMTDLCQSHPGLLISSLGSVVNGLLKLFIDEDREVRKATLNFLKETFMDIDRIELQPFMPLLVIYTCSAMTHIFEDVRHDAVKIMDIWIQIAPDVLISKFWTRVIGNYMSLLAVDANRITNTNTTPAATTTSGIKAAVTKSHLHIHKNKLDLFKSLSRFLGAGLAQDEQDEFWFLYSYLDHKHARGTFKQKRQEKVVEWDIKIRNGFSVSHPMAVAVAPTLSDSLLNYSHLHLFESSGPKNTHAINPSSANQTSVAEVHQNEFSSDERTSHIKELIETFQPILVASWLETAPNVFMSVNTISMSPALELLSEILRLSLVLWRAMVGSNTITSLPKQWLQSHLQTLLKHLTVYFPYGADGFGQRGSQVDEIIQDMNIRVCELTSLYLLARSMQNNQNQVADPEEVPDWAETVVGYVLEMLGSDGASVSSSFRANNLTSLLPAIWGFLNCLSYEESIGMFKAMVDYYQACQANSASKRVLFDFIASIYRIQSTPSYNGQFVIYQDSELANVLKGWVLSLPKMLWQLRSNYVETTRSILNILCDIVKRGDKDIFDLSLLLEVETKLVPFFYVNIAKGPMFGPFMDLPVDVQQRALDYVNYLNSQSEKMAFAINQCKQKGPIGLYQ